jgi:hypothetical protein
MANGIKIALNLGNSTHKMRATIPEMRKVVPRKGNMVLPKNIGWSWGMVRYMPTLGCLSDKPILARFRGPLTAMA